MILTRFRKLSAVIAAAIAFATVPLATPAHAEEPAATPAAAASAAPAAASAEPASADDVKDIHAYFNNVAPSATGKLNGIAGPGHNAFLMICAALVLFMTLPGLALFYGGLVRSKNVLSICAQCLGIAGLVTIMWWAFGYSLIFGTNFKSPFIGGSEYFFLKDVGAAPNTTYAAWPSQSVFCMYQLMFAIITPALIIGAVAERMKFKAIMVFVALWMVVVYFPMAHMVWGGTGLMNGVWNADAKITAIDFAGGTVVHMTSGWSALILCLILGKRLGFGKDKMSPHSMVLCMVGTGMLWVGWYGFNAGSALAADGVAANAFMTTTLAAATAGFVWALIEGVHRGKPSVLGFCSGVVAGLVVITPACGFVTANGAMIIGLLAGLIPYIFVTILKGKFGYDDALDTFGVHAVGGTLGAIVTGFLASSDANANLLLPDYAGKNGLAVADAAGKLVLNKSGLITGQFIAIGITLAISIIATIVIALIVKAVVGLRPTAEEESMGLDLADHGEEGYEH
ncbi:ammonium transporter [Luteolibacter ambystomatis]|uniref:Ammonium transporter n=1 Tax=Luteolibacter ambystomatis TaxID=2824561 RepID=A0A975IZ13_9BACT|nr:ammonium transporter [Luteolibacter ambystomatis]QUE50699.1 ammonium transporter [Luteolibacter ambystomatis]